jgi:hypothetical protein
MTDYSEVSKNLRDQAKKVNADNRYFCMFWRGKLSARQIAEDLGITRNAVIGHWYRGRKAEKRAAK